MPLNKQPLIHTIQRGKLIADALIGAWPFYEGSGGTTVNNVVGEDQRHGTWAGTGSRWTSIDGGFAGSFNGSDDTVSIPNADGRFSFNNITTGFSLAAKVASASNSTMYIIDNRITSARGYILLVTAGALTFTVRYANTVSASATFTFDGLPHAVVATADIANGVNLYMDGALVANTATAVGTGAIASEQSVYIGSDGGSASFWNGTISDVRIYNRVMSAQGAARYSAGFG